MCARRRKVGVADAEADDVDPGRSALGDLALDAGEQVRRQALHALRESHGSPRIMWLAELPLLKVIEELLGEVAVVDLLGRPGHEHAPVRPHVDHQLAAREAPR